MFTQQDVDMIAVELPAKGIDEIAVKAHVSRPTVYRFFQGIKVRYQYRIYMAALVVVEKERIRIRRVQAKHAKLFGQSTQKSPLA